MVEGTAAPPPGWEGILAPGERIIWQGRPRQGLFHTGPRWLGMLYGLLLAVFGPWIALHYADPVMRALGAALALLAIWLLLIRHLVDALRRRFTQYTLTNRRAFIGIAIPFLPRVLRHWEINDPEAVVPLPPHGAAFHRKPIYGGKHGGRSWERRGFEALEDSAEVLALLTAVARGPRP